MKLHVRQGPLRQVKSMTSKWVHTWKKKPLTGERYIHARLCLRGFQDVQAALLAVMAAVAMMMSHRIFAGVATQARRKLGSKDISGAFLQGISFDELSKDAREMLREVYFMLPSLEDWQLLAQVDGVAYGLLFLHYLHELILQALKGAYGLKDAPRLWRKRLHQWLLAKGFVQSVWDECIYHLYPGWAMERSRRALASVKAKSLDQLIEEERQRPPQPTIDATAPLADLSVNTHVDDLSHVGTPQAEEWFTRELDKEFGQTKSQEWDYPHVGSTVQQKKSRDEIFVHQQ